MARRIITVPRRETDLPQLQPALDRAHEEYVKIPDKMLTPLDRQLFIPLAGFFMNDKSTSGDLFDFIKLVGNLPWLERMQSPQGRSDNSRGFVMEAYVKWGLARFMNSPGGRGFSFVRAGKGVLDSGTSYRVGDWGNVTFYTRDRETRQTYPIEIDGLCELFREGALSSVMVEASIKGKMHRVRTKKAPLVREFYCGYADVYVCKFTLAKNEGEAGLWPSRNYLSRRKFALPVAEKIEAAAEKVISSLPSPLLEPPSLS
jgi:hypothetical protein